MHSFHWNDPTHPSLLNTKKRGEKRTELFLLWLLGRAQPHTTNSRDYLPEYIPLWSNERKHPSCCETHWIYMAEKTQRNFTHIREGNGYKRLECRHFNPPSVLCVCTHTQTHTQSPFSCWRYSGTEQTVHVDKLLNSTTCRGELTGHRKESLSGFLSGAYTFIETAPKWFPEMTNPDLHINTSFEDRNTPMNETAFIINNFFKS